MRVSACGEGGSKIARRLAAASKGEQLAKSSRKINYVEVEAA